MNLYFLVEGRTEAKIYPKWFAYLLPQFKQVKYYEDVTEQNYYLFKANGYPAIINTHLPNAIKEVNEIGKYQHLVLCWDADEQSVIARKQEVIQYLEQQQLSLNKVELTLIVQNCCIETWLLGNRKIYKRTPQDKHLLAYTQFYNVALNDPELMGKHLYFETRQQFHKAYFKSLCRARNIKYSENNPQGVWEKNYLAQLQLRVKETKHLKTFATLLEFCIFVNNQ